MFHIVTGPIAAHGSNKGKLTCLTCKLKKCVGRCHFERIPDAPRKAA